MQKTQKLYKMSIVGGKGEREVVCLCWRFPNDIFGVQKTQKLHKMSSMEWQRRKGGGVSVLEGNKEWIGK